MTQPIIFPGLNLTLTIDPVAFRLMGFEIRWYGIIIAFGIGLGLFLALRHAHRFGFQENNILDFLLIVIPFAVVGARLYFVAFKWDQYKDNPISILYFHQGGLAIYGAVIVSIIIAFLYTGKRKLNRMAFIDFLIPYLALGQAIGRWGNFVNQEAHGMTTDVPWRMDIYVSEAQKRFSVHPTFLYESLGNFALFFLLIWFRKHKKKHGGVFLLYLSLYGLLRCIVEGMRTDSLYWGRFRVSQLLAGILFITTGIAFLLLQISGKHKTTSDSLSTKV
jgi:phosphatidylglycerol---prolipoprotein diacylglyceryl transferase